MSGTIPWLVQVGFDQYKYMGLQKIINMPERPKYQQFVHNLKALKQAACKISQQKFKQAEYILSQLLHIDPSISNALYLYSYCLDQQQKLPQFSQKLRQQAQNLNYDFFQYNNFDGNKICTKIMMIQNMAEKIYPSLRESTGREWVNCVQFFLRARDFDTCKYILKLFEAIKLPYDKYSDQNLSNIGVKYFQLSMYQESIVLHELAVLASPTDVMYYNNLSILNYAMQNYEKSLEYNLKTLQLQPNRTKSYYVQSFILLKLGKISQGLQRCKYALQKQPDQLLFQIKQFINESIYHEHHHKQKQEEDKKQIKKSLEKALKTIKQGQVTKQYFTGDDFFPEVFTFLNQNFQYYATGKVNIGDWNQYLGCLDQYLIKGLRDKLKLKKWMANISAKIGKQIQQIKQQQNQEKKQEQSHTEQPMSLQLLNN